MDDQETGKDVIEQTRALRIFTGEDPGASVEESVGVVAETTVTIDIVGLDSYTVLCTPTDLRAMVVGFLYTEGIICSLEDIEHYQQEEGRAGDAARVRVKLRGEALKNTGPGAGRNLLVVSSCGMCGSESLDQKVAALPLVGDSLQLAGRVLREAAASLSAEQVLFRASGCTHAAGIFDEQGRMMAMAEDTGRHIALDKAIGRCLLSDRAVAGHGAMLSGRVSLEMVSKCARAGIELIAAISAPTSLALAVAEQCNITLCAFVRDTRATVFTHPRRITG